MVADLDETDPGHPYNWYVGYSDCFSLSSGLRSPARKAATFLEYALRSWLGYKADIAS
jgi:hypothetical protein